MSIGLDLLFKNALINATEELSLADVYAIAAAHESKLNYLRRLLTVTEADAAVSLNLYNPNQFGPTIYPQSFSGLAFFQLAFNPPGPGVDIRFETGHVSARDTPDVSASSPIWTHGASALTFWYSTSPVPTIIKAQYFTKSVFNPQPASAQSMTIYRVPLNIALLTLVRDAALSDANKQTPLNFKFSRELAVALTVWLDPDFAGKRSSFLDALTYRAQNAIGALRALAPLNSWGAVRPGQFRSTITFPPIHPPLT